MKKYLVQSLFFTLITFAMFCILGEKNTKVYAAESNPFTDVSEKHWAYEDIKWATKNKLLVGYSDGTFRPDTALTEEHFAAVLARYFNPNIDNAPVDPKDWSKKYYDYLATLHFKLSGHTTTKGQYLPMSRISLAEALAASQGQYGTTLRVIDWMYYHGLTVGNGKFDDKYQDFGTNDNLTRASVSAFFRRMEKLNMTTSMADQKNEIDVPAVQELKEIKEVPLQSLRGKDFLKEIEMLYLQSNFTFNLSFHAREGLYSYSNYLGEYEKGWQSTPKIDFDLTNDHLVSIIYETNYLEGYTLVSKSLRYYGVDVVPEEFGLEMFKIVQSANDKEMTEISLDKFRITITVYGSDDKAAVIQVYETGK